MEDFLQNGLRLLHDGFRLGTDSVLLSQFVTLPRRARVADLGSGCGSLGLLLCARDGECSVTGIELDESAHALALQNIENNRLAHRMTALHGDVRELRALLPAGGFDCVLSNPPYFPPRSGKLSEKAPSARSELTLPLQALCSAAAWLLQTGGRFSVVHRPERLCDLFCAMRENGLEPKRLRFVRHRADCPPNLVLIEARRGGRPGLQTEADFISQKSDGTPTDEYRAAYHIGDDS